MASKGCRHLLAGEARVCSHASGQRPASTLNAAVLARNAHVRCDRRASPHSWSSLSPQGIRVDSRTPWRGWLRAAACLVQAGGGSDVAGSLDGGFGSGLGLGLGCTPVAPRGAQLVHRRDDQERGGQVEHHVGQRPQVGVRRGAAVVAHAAQLRAGRATRCSALISYFLKSHDGFGHRRRPC